LADESRFSTRAVIAYICFGHASASATQFISRFGIPNSVIGMSRRLQSKEFLALADILWQGSVKVKYQNPDNWIVT
jgi:hypothetical protein